MLLLSILVLIVRAFVFVVVYYHCCLAVAVVNVYAVVFIFAVSYHCLLASVEEIIVETCMHEPLAC